MDARAPNWDGTPPYFLYEYTNHDYLPPFFFFYLVSVNQVGLKKSGSVQNMLIDCYGLILPPQPNLLYY